MNKYILLVMKWLNDNDSVTTEELKINADVVADVADVDAASFAADVDVDAASFAVAPSFSAFSASFTADAADADADVAAVARWVRIYFDQTGENRADYEAVLIEETKPVYTQEKLYDLALEISALDGPINARHTLNELLKILNITRK